MTAPLAQRCYRHPYVETYVRCTRCSRPICPDCMVPASVGHQCPECVREGQRGQRSVQVRRAAQKPYATYGVIAASIVMMAVTSGGTDARALYRYGASFGPAVAAGEWWRLVTPMFLHAGIFHLGFNMMAMFFYGQGLEQAIGTPRFAGLFLVSGFAGNALSIAVRPYGIGVGASGAVFGILGAWAIWFYRRRGNPYAEQMLRGIAGIVAINLLFGFASGGRIDNWAHIGGLVGGAVVGFASDDAIGHRSRVVTLWSSISAMAVVAGAGALLVFVRLGSVDAFRLVQR